MPNCNALATDENVFFNHQLFLEQGTKQKQKSYQHTRRDAQTKPIVSPVMRFRAAGDRLPGWGLAASQDGSEASLPAMLYG